MKSKRWQVKVTFDPIQDADILAEVLLQVERGAAAATTIKAQLRERLALLELKALQKDLLGTSVGPAGPSQVLLPQPGRSPPDEEAPPSLDLMAGFLPD